MTEITDKQIELAREIHELRMQIEGWDYWKPHAGQWVSRRPSEPFLIQTDYDALEMRKYYIHRGHFPLLTWTDCRERLRDMGWLLWSHEDAHDGCKAKGWVELFLYRKTPTGLIRRPTKGYFIDDIKGPDDLTIIYQALVEALKRKRDADKEERDEN